MNEMNLILQDLIDDGNILGLCKLFPTAIQSMDLLDRNAIKGYKSGNAFIHFCHSTRLYQIRMDVLYCSCPSFIINSMKSFHMCKHLLAVLLWKGEYVEISLSDFIAYTAN